MADVIHGIVSDPSVRNIDEPRPLPIDPATDSVRVVVAGGVVPLPFGYAKGSGTLAADPAQAATFGYAADEPATLATTPIQYVRNSSTANVKLSIFVTSNTFAGTQITFTLYKNGAPTLLTIPVAATLAGYFTGGGVFPYLATDTWDLRVDNPGGVPGDIAAAISFGFGLDWF